MKAKTKFLKTRLAIAVASILLAIVALNAVLSTVSASAFTLNEDATYETEYTSIEEANEAAAETFSESVAEGTVLLKNDGTLPLSKGMYLSIFGNSTMASGIKAGGYKVYNTSTMDPSSFTSTEKSKLKSYSDAAVVLIESESGGEGSSVGYYTSEVEDNEDASGRTYTYEDGTEFTHKSLAYKTGNPDVTYKHPLELSDANERLIKYVTENYSRVIVVICGSSIMEVGNLQVNDDINAILWTGSISGASGTLEALSDLFNGTTSPSGKTNQIWGWDFTAETTWYNDGNADAVGSSGSSFSSASEEDAYEYEGVNTTKAFRTSDGNYYTRAEHTASDVTRYVYAVEYEEDIYTGYRYYETAAAEAELNNYTYDYDKAVVYPFGYGLSYTSFEQEIISVTKSDWGKTESEYTYGGTMTIKVKVTNTGSVAGKEVVQIYGHSPYFKGGVEKTENVLLAFDKTATLNPGQSETVTLTVNIQDMASFDWSDANNNGKTTYELDKNAEGVDSANHTIHDSSNNYELRLQGDSHNVLDTYTLSALTNDIILSTDDYSGNEVESLFTGDDMYNTLSYDYGTQKTLVEEGKMTLLSRSDFEGTWPEIATKDDMTRSDKYFESVDAFAEYEADNTSALAEYLGADATATEDNAGFPWSVTKTEFETSVGKNWSQLADSDAQDEQCLCSCTSPLSNGSYNSG